MPFTLVNLRFTVWSKLPLGWNRNRHLPAFSSGVEAKPPGHSRAAPPHRVWSFVWWHRLHPGAFVGNFVGNFVERVNSSPR